MGGSTIDHDYAVISNSILRRVPHPLIDVLTHFPVPRLQESFVQGLPSSQFLGVPTHLPPAHVSPLQEDPEDLGVCTHFPVAGLQVSVVHE